MASCLSTRVLMTLVMMMGPVNLASAQTSTAESTAPPSPPVETAPGVRGGSDDAAAAVKPVPSESAVGSPKVVSSPNGVSSEPPKPVVNDSDLPAGYRAFGREDWILLGASSAVALGTTFLGPRSSPWTERWAVDEEIREGVRLSSAGARETARLVSDVLLLATISYPLVIDAFLVTYWKKKRPALALELALADAEAYLVSAAIQGVTNVVASRERPYARECGGVLDPESPECIGSNRYRSFFSGHASTAFTAAGLLCAHHMLGHVYGSVGADIAACAGSVGVAGTLAVLRVMGDMHYASDIVVGSAVGFGVGYALPALLHYPRGGLLQVGGRDGAHFSFAPMPGGISLRGVF